VLEDHPGQEGVKKFQRTFTRELVEMVRYAGLLVAVFVTLTGHPRERL
jgi:hypothetical protein